MGDRHDNVLQIIGSKPITQINRPIPAGVNLYVKVESFNPTGL